MAFFSCGALYFLSTLPNQIEGPAWWTRQQIIDEGVVTTGVISQCIPWYFGSVGLVNFEIDQGEGSPKTVEFRQGFPSPGPVSTCNVGEKVTVYYLPESPDKVVALEGGVFVNWAGVIFIFMVSFSAGWLVWDGIRRPRRFITPTLFWD